MFSTRPARVQARGDAVRTRESWREMHVPRPAKGGSRANSSAREGSGSGRDVRTGNAALTDRVGHLSIFPPNRPHPGGLGSAGSPPGQHPHGRIPMSTTQSIRRRKSLRLAVAATVALPDALRRFPGGVDAGQHRHAAVRPTSRGSPGGAGTARLDSGPRRQLVSGPGSRAGAGTTGRDGDGRRAARRPPQRQRELGDSAQPAGSGRGRRAAGRHAVPRWQSPALRRPVGGREPDRLPHVRRARKRRRA